jgi:hypothetical protein
MSDARPPLTFCAQLRQVDKFAKDVRPGDRLFFYCQSSEPSYEPELIRLTRCGAQHAAAVHARH